MKKQRTLESFSKEVLLRYVRSWCFARVDILERIEREVQMYKLEQELRKAMEEQKKYSPPQPEWWEWEARFCKADRKLRKLHGLKEPA